ncbi:hypothetical protein A4A32_01800 [Staphylococcus equorum]|uniref:hypothetical protein n=1 Tax=Staphylococcus equorum TaxID=246432 RepID=UPI0008FB20A2|nr:hypothetical protein [Staphylococcus equorum]OIS56067.1 hypothetical protein A4A32_01800 [Staphylococcus equorum]
MRTAKYEYVVYKGDEVICGGTRKEIMLKMNITGGAFDSMASTRRHNHVKNIAAERGGHMIAEKVSIAEIEKELELT